MCAIALNYTPLLTRHLVEELRIFAEDPLVIFDVGARFGSNAEWDVFGDQMRVYCFEPDEEECERLTAQAPPYVTYVPTALGRISGDATLYESKLSSSTSLFKTRMDYFGRFVNRNNGVVVGERTVAVKSLDDTMATYGISHVDFVKLDAEGAELDILKGGEHSLRSDRLLGVLSEIRLHEEINGSPPFASLDAFLRTWGLRLYNIQVNHHGRVVLPYPQVEDYRLPSGERFYAYTAHGQVQDGDALYFRDLFAARESQPTSILKLCALMEIYHLNDCAAELIMINRKRLVHLVDVDHVLNLLTEGVCGRKTTYLDYITSYYAPTADAPPPTQTKSSSHPQGDESNGSAETPESIVSSEAAQAELKRD